MDSFSASSLRQIVQSDLPLLAMNRRFLLRGLWTGIRHSDEWKLVLRNRFVDRLLLVYLLPWLVHHWSQDSDEGGGHPPAPPCRY